MAHDKNGTELAVGDIVTMEFEVTAVQRTTDYCNLTLTSVEPMFPGEHKSMTTANGKQVVKK